MPISQLVEDKDALFKLRQVIAEFNKLEAGLQVKQPAIPDAIAGLELTTINSILAVLRANGTIDT